MTATVLGIKTSGKGGSIKRKDSVRDFQIVFKVTTDNRSDGAVVVINAAGLPRLGDPYNIGNEFDSGSTVTGIVADETDDSLNIWEVTVTYSSVQDKDDDRPLNPLARDPVVKLTFTNVREVARGLFNTQSPPPPPAGGVSFYDTALSNSAGEIFDPPPERDRSRPVISIVRNEEFIKPTALMDFADTVNSIDFLGAPPRTVKMAAPTADLLKENDQQFWQVGYAMEYNKETWDFSLPDQGTYFNNSTGGGAISPKSTDAKKFVVEGTPSIGNLDGNAKAAADGVVFYQVFEVYEQRDFNTLNFGKIPNITS